MAITQLYSGTEAVSTTEWSLTTDTSGPDVDTTAGVYQCFLDLNALAAGDYFLFRIYEKVRSGDTQRKVQTVQLTGVQTDPIFVSPALALLQGWDMTLLKVAGTDRTILWSIRQLG